MKKIIRFAVTIARRLFYQLHLYHIANKMHIYTPRIVALVDGGLGSQMWQFALGYSISKKVGLPLTFETSFYTVSGRDCNGKKNRNLLLFDIFPVIREQYGNNIETSKSYLTFFCDSTKRTTYDYTPSLLMPGRPVFLSQYYANSKYIQENCQELKKIFQFTPCMNAEETALLHQIERTNSCMVHIRKGDFVGLCLDVCTDAYYINAIHKMAELENDVDFFIFSNDETYFEKHIEPHCQGYKFHIIKQRSEENPSIDFYLMKQCKHAIISNSGFSWMAAWLKEDSARVIMPDRWNNDSTRSESSKNAFYHQKWLKLSVNLKCNGVDCS
ncbi:MAG: alpha-1,2-fucosyltransferase [Akkermansia sp.]|nr:alpha-1,2-fucosyltransferase [Akkermansia sp.]